MDRSNNEVVSFDHVYNGERHRCGYRIVGDKFAVVVGEKKWIAELDRMMPERLAHVLAHELLVEADFAKTTTQDRPGFNSDGGRADRLKAPPW